MNDGEPDNSGIGGQLAVCMWIFTKTVLCNGQRNIEEFQEPEKELRDRCSQLVVQQGLHFP